MKLLDDYFELQAKIFEHFGYREDWRVIPLDDAREYFWRIDGEGPGEVHYAKTEQELADETGDYYVNEIYTQRFLPKWVYRASDYTMVCVDTHTDGNKFLQVFDNALERPNQEEGRSMDFCASCIRFALMANYRALHSIFGESRSTPKE